jgi:hypothetical protein
MYSFLTSNRTGVAGLWAKPVRVPVQLEDYWRFGILDKRPRSRLDFCTSVAGHDRGTTTVALLVQDKTTGALGRTIFMTLP